MGHIAFKRPDPVMLLEYWNNPQATRDKFVGDWLLTGDLGLRDEDGYFWYRGRADDVITSAGYRIGPGEIEEALLRHPAVRLAAVIGVPDRVRTESIKAFLVLAEDKRPSRALEHEICEFVKTRLARHEYPQAIEFVDSLPSTTTGKIMRHASRIARARTGEGASSYLITTVVLAKAATTNEIRPRGLRVHTAWAVASAHELNPPLDKPSRQHWTSEPRGWRRTTRKRSHDRPTRRRAARGVSLR